MKKLKSKNDIKRIKKFLRKVDGGDIYADLLDECYADFLENRDSLIRKIEQQNKIRADQDFLEVIDAEGGTHRYTVNPCTGRHTLKIAKKSSNKVMNDLVEIVKSQLNNKELPLTTLRGKISWDKQKCKYSCILYSESKKFKHLVI